MICPKCGREQQDGQDECLKCGVIFSKISPISEEDLRPGRSRLTRTKCVAAFSILVLGIVCGFSFGGGKAPEPLPESAMKETLTHKTKMEAQERAETSPEFSTIKLKALLVRTISDLERMKAWEVNEYVKELVTEADSLSASVSVPPQEKKLLLEKAAVQLEVVKPIASKKDLQEKMDTIKAEYDQKRQQIERETEMKIFKIKTDALREGLN